jgi:drug/metabolite transporter (DMT)-like permease
LAIIAGGNGFITWGMRFVPSGLSSVIGSLTPVLVALFALLWKDNKEKMSKLTILGVLTGFVGMGLVFSDGWADFLNPDYRWGIAGCFASCCTWSLGTVMSKRYNDHQVSPLMNAGLQITTGGFGGFILSALFDTTHKINHTWEGWIAVSYLILIGSALAFTLYMFVLKHLNVTISSLYTYINPIVAILLGWLLLGESFTWLELFGIAVTIFGVWLVNKGAR